MPQHITVQLQDGLCQVSSVQFVTHESLVPAIVEVYTSETCPPQEWVRLGHVVMGENKNTNARERKTFRFQIKARLIKFSFPQISGAIPNPTGQISLASVVIRGQKLQMQPVINQ